MKKLTSLLLAVIIFISNASAQSIRLKNDNLNLVLSGSGQISEIADPSTNKNYLAAGQQAPLLKIRVANEWEESNMASFSKEKNTITLSFPSAKVAATIKVTQNKTHFVFELIHLSSKNKVNAIMYKLIIIRLKICSIFMWY